MPHFLLYCRCTITNTSIYDISTVLSRAPRRRLCAVLVTKSNKMYKMKIENLENSSR